VSYFDIKLKTEIMEDELKKIKGFFDNQQQKIYKFHRALHILHGPILHSRCECIETETMFKCIYKYHNFNPPDSFYDLMAEMHNINKEMKLFHTFCEYWKKSVFDPEVGHVCHYEKIQIELIQKNTEISELKCSLQSYTDKIDNNDRGTIKVVTGSSKCHCQDCSGMIRCVCKKCHKMGKCKPTDSDSHSVFKDEIVTKIKKSKNVHKK